MSSDQRTLMMIQFAPRFSRLRTGTDFLLRRPLLVVMTSIISPVTVA